MLMLMLSWTTSAESFKQQPSIRCRATLIHLSRDRNRGCCSDLYKHRSLEIAEQALTSTFQKNYRINFDMENSWHSELSWDNLRHPLYPYEADKVKDKKLSNLNKNWKFRYSGLYQKHILTHRQYRKCITVTHKSMWPKKWPSTLCNAQRQMITSNPYQTLTYGWLFIFFLLVVLLSVSLPPCPQSLLLLFSHHFFLVGASGSNWRVHLHALCILRIYQKVTVEK